METRKWLLLFHLPTSLYQLILLSVSVSSCNTLFLFKRIKIKFILYFYRSHCYLVVDADHLLRLPSRWIHRLFVSNFSIVSLCYDSNFRLPSVVDTITGDYQLFSTRFSYSASSGLRNGSCCSCWCSISAS